MEVVQTKSVQTKLITRDGFVTELKGIAQTILKKWLVNNSGSVNFANVIMLAMNIVETYSSTVATVSSGDKLQAAKDMIPVVVDICVEQKVLTEEQGNSLKEKLTTASDIVINIIEAYIAISKNPAFIQAVQEIEEVARKCWASCKK